MQKLVGDLEESVAKKDWERVKELVFKLRMTRRVQEFGKEWD